MAKKAIKAVGEDRIKKQVFGVKSPLDRLLDTASEIVGETLFLHGYGCDELALKSKDTKFTYFVIRTDLTFSFNTLWNKFHKLSFSKRKQLIEVVLEYYEEIKNNEVESK